MVLGIKPRGSVSPMDYATETGLRPL